MRLLQLKNDGEFNLVEYVGKSIPRYAILSHTWGADEEEVTFKDLMEGTGKTKPGYRKLIFCGKQAALDGLQYFWVDTCCIDKSSSAELSEAINSMFRWYQNATRCYVYLSDVSTSHLVGNDFSSEPARQPWEIAFRHSKWFTRGWTLQELLAPASVEFFSVEGEGLGDKLSMVQALHDITGIAIQALQGSPLDQFPVDERMLWAKGRDTKREEDAAYSLLGIFDVHMPLIYGEGRKKAFVRLQREIREISAEQSPTLQRTPAASTPLDLAKAESSILEPTGTPPDSSSPGWTSPLSLSSTMMPNAPLPTPQQQRYPVLQPLLPYLVNKLSFSAAYDLLELYFHSSGSSAMQPPSPYTLGYVFRKESFLRQRNPRTCSPALLASMLWIGCLTSESNFLASSRSARSRVSEMLLGLTVSLLKPLVHQFDRPWQEGQPENTSVGALGDIDDVITYSHIGIVFSAGEHDTLSLRWWNAAWVLGRELKLSREVQTTPSSEEGANTPSQSLANLTEEQQEERRRVWWMLFMMDRHLALCYNKPLALLDIECSNLRIPVITAARQAGESSQVSSQSFADSVIRRGPVFECCGDSIFGFFLPLMTILGEIVDLNHARYHPRFGSRIDWSDHMVEITQQLEVYKRSLGEFNARASAEAHSGINPETTSAASLDPTTFEAEESLLRAKTAVAYGTYIMHTLHILLYGKWDPISLLDDNDLWISSESFISATGHAIAAAQSLNEILELDPDLSFIPFFFGIYLLHGSLLLLLIIDKLGSEASPSVVHACEIVVRAHEASVVTLHKDYQRNFRTCLRSALQQARGRGIDRHAESIQQRRREILGLYRWTGDGFGLALN